MSRTLKLGSMVVLVVVVVGALVLGAAVTAKDGPEAPVELQAAIESEPLTKVLDLPSADGAPARAMFVQPTSAGFVCVWDAPSATSRIRQGGCYHEDDPLAGHAVAATLAYDGGPGISGVKDARLVGFTAGETASVQVLMTDGSRRGMKLQKAKLGSDEFQAFGYRFKKADLEKGIGPVAIVALDADGTEIGRQPTGIG
jgi:hypothetical protein